MSRPARTPHRSAGQRAGLTRDVILDAARRIADEEGLERLTMRYLSAELGVAPNALYSYFADKEALLDALLDALLGDIELQDPAKGDWRDGLAVLMDSSRRVLLAHPDLVSLFLSRATLGPNAARLGEQTFQLLRRGGMEGQRAVEAFRVMLIFTLGFAAFQTPRQGADAAARTERGREAFGTLPPEEFPEMRRVAEHLATHPTTANFHTGLRWLLDGMRPRNEA